MESLFAQVRRAVLASPSVRRSPSAAIFLPDKVRPRHQQPILKRRPTQGCDPDDMLGKPLGILFSPAGLLPHPIFF